MPDDIRVEDLNACIVGFEEAGQKLLMILLARDGSINRLGDGLHPAETTLHIGTTREPLFERLLEVVEPDLLRFMGRLELPDREGRDCELTVTFQHEDGRGLLFQILFGSENGAIPNELRRIIERALELTDAFWRETGGLDAAQRRGPPFEARGSSADGGDARRKGRSAPPIRPGEGCR
jgi:hypothetical protein